RSLCSPRKGTTLSPNHEQYSHSGAGALDLCQSRDLRFSSTSTERAHLVTPDRLKRCI
ncbi:hypothetical protein RRG08_056384, partial [Elysia crispata]